MKLAVTLGSLLILAGLLFIDFKGYQSLLSVRAELRDLKQQVLETHEYAEREAAAASAATARADEARKHAEEAAGARKQAETQSQEAESRRQQAESARQKAETQMEAMRREREEELNRMQEALNRIVETRRTPNGMVMILPDSVFRFEFDSAELNPKNRELLSRIAGVLLVSKGYGLAVHGYTDDVGTVEYNKQLSLRRAKAVQDYLAHSGIDPTIMTVAGFGKSDPRVKGTTDEARAQNRRVEIALTDSSIQYTGEAPSR